MTTDAPQFSNDTEMSVPVHCCNLLIKVTVRSKVSKLHTLIRVIVVKMQPNKRKNMALNWL